MKDLEFNNFFSTPVYTLQIPQWVKKLNKASDNFIEKSKKINKKNIKEREKIIKKKIGDFGLSHHSTSLLNVLEFEEIKLHVEKEAQAILDHMGYDLKNYILVTNEMWVQEFAKNGGGHHEGHVHYNSHISAFYFLKCSDKTSFPVFHDPRTGKLMSDLPLKDVQELSFANPIINYKPSPGTLILFPAFLQHQFSIDCGIEPFRFIHFNIQALPKEIVRNINGF